MWLFLIVDVDGSWSVQTEELRGQGAVDYLAVEPSCEGVYIASEANFKFSKAEEMQPVNGMIVWFLTIKITRLWR